MTRRSIVVFIVLMVSYGYFYEGGGWNQNVRFDLVRAIVEEGTVQIDAYHENTGDKAHVGDHYYLEKAPGASLTAVPVVALARGLVRAVHGRVRATRSIVFFSYLATLTAAAVPAALAAMAVLWIGLRLGASAPAATVGALVCGLATPIWPYATILYGHTLAAGCLMLALLGSLVLRDSMPDGRRLTIAALTGFAVGWAVVTEYPAAVAGGLILLGAAWMLWRSNRQHAVSSIAAIAAGGLVAAIALLIYNRIVFGLFFHIAYSSEPPEMGFPAMQTGIFGVNWPQWGIFTQLLVGQFRGLLPLAPVLALAPVGLGMLMGDRRGRPAVIAACGVVVFYFLMDSGYAYWSGGWSYASRHVGPSLPFLCLGISPIWDRGGRIGRTLVLVLGAIGVAQSLIAVATTPQPPVIYRRPMQELLWPAFVSGDFPIGWQSIQDYRPPAGSLSDLEQRGVPRASWNVGQLIGLKGHASLIPLYAVWIAGAVIWWRSGRRTGRVTPAT